MKRIKYNKYINSNKLNRVKDFYKNDFEKFLSHTNEKEILLKEISKEIKKYKIKSLLDIGAGNGLLSIPLSKRVKNYLAIEPNKNFAKKLRGAGLRVIEKKFPFEISESFDMILSSHSISYQKSFFEPFIKKAWKLVKKNGIFLIITYRGEEDDWTRFMKKLGINYKNKNRKGFNQIIKLLTLLGDVKIRKVITKVNAENLDDIIQALSFVASDGDRHRKKEFLKRGDKIEKILNRNYKDKQGYYFPFQHFFLITKKL
jgi:SAM-dependent methyltransferase